MRSDILRGDQEVLADPGYQRLVRVALAVRLLAWVGTIVLGTTGSVAAWVVLAACLALSVWSVLDPAFLRRYVRHPAIVLSDTTLVVAGVLVDPVPSLSVFALAVTALLVGLLLKGWLALPALILLLAAVFQLGVETSVRAPGSSPFFSVGFPLLVLSLVVLGWAVRSAFVELHRSRVVLAAEQARRHQEEERARLAREMHDSLGKTLHGIHLASSAMRLAARNGDVGVVDELAGDIQAASRTAADEGRSILRGLRRHQLDRPLVEVLGEVARRRSTDTLTVRTEIDGVADLPAEVAREVVRVVEEALENVRRHADATRAWVRLHGEEGRVTAEVEDDGSGFDPGLLARREREGHFGVRGMRERVERLGGQFVLDSEPGRGTRVLTCWPQHTMEEVG